MDNQITRRSNNSSNPSGSITRTRRNTYTTTQVEENEDEEEYTQQEIDVASGSTKVHYRIGIVLSIIIAGAALGFDLLELILSLISGGLASYIKDFAVIILFPATFTLLGAPFWSGKKRVQKMATMGVGFLFSLIPYISDIAPELFISVLVTLILTRVEDKLATKTKFMQKIASITRKRRS